ncbi:MAG: succinyl-diaminopimelate desuccinylase [Proteobacteria bacterium]|nr:succinyl-diaminopimelate desuccinylase [Pseudomonadota bacterium]
MTMLQTTQSTPLAAAAASAVGAHALELAQKLIRIPSETPVQPELFATAQASLDALEAELSAAGATCTRMVFEGNHHKWPYPVDNLYAEWIFGTPNRHLCYMGHTDVVPVGDRTRWSDTPYSGTIKDGFLYGRGATDMKGSVAAFAAAAMHAAALLDDQANMRLSLLITTDEEWAAVNGSKRVLGWMATNGREPDAVIVGEPSSQDTFGTHIKIGRRGSLCGTLEVKGVQGHAAYTDLFKNPNRALALAMSILTTQTFDDAEGAFPATNFEVVATESGNFGATAIIPGTARALWNFRYTHKQTAQGLADRVKDLLANPPAWAKNHPDAAKLADVQVLANIDTASQPYYAKPAKLAALAVDAVTQATGRAPVLDGSGGTTDGRFVHDYFPHAEIIELGLPEKGGMPQVAEAAPYGSIGGMHQIDERCRVDELMQLADVFANIIGTFASTYQMEAVQ